MTLLRCMAMLPNDSVNTKKNSAKCPAIVPARDISIFINAPIPIIPKDAKKMIRINGLACIKVSI